MFKEFRGMVTERLKALGLDQQEKDINDLVDKATAESLPAADWGLNMELVDIINSDPGPASDKTCRALKRTLAKPSVHCQILALTLLETIAKNTSGAFHHFFVRSELWQDLRAVGTALRAFDPEVRDKILGLIEDFAGGVPVPQYREAYEQLLDAGMDFPVRPESEAVPYYTPPTRPADALHGVSAEDRAAIQEAMRQMDVEEQGAQQQQQQQQQQQAAPYLPIMPAPATQGLGSSRRGTPPPQSSPMLVRPEDLMQVGPSTAAAWLAGRLDGRSAGRLAGWLAGWLGETCSLTAGATPRQRVRGRRAALGLGLPAGRGCGSWHSRRCGRSST
jgi:hypothetical protein